MLTRLRIAAMLLLALGLTLPSHAQDQPVTPAKPGDAAPATPAAPDAPDAGGHEFITLGASALALPVDPELAESERPPGLVWVEGNVLIIGWDLPQHPVGLATKMLTPEAITAQLKVGKNPKLISTEEVKLEHSPDATASLSMMSIETDTGLRKAMLMLVGDDRFCSGMAAIPAGELTDEQVARVRAHLLRVWWDDDQLADSLTDNLNLTVRAPLPLRFASKNKKVVIFSDALTEQLDAGKHLAVVMVEESKPARIGRPAFNMSRMKGLSPHVINPRSPKHEEFKFGEFNALTTTAEGDSPDGSGERVLVMTSIFMPDRVCIVEGVTSKARAAELAGCIKEIVESIAFDEDPPAPPDGPVAPEAK